MPNYSIVHRIRPAGRSAAWLRAGAVAALALPAGLASAHAVTSRTHEATPVGRAAVLTGLHQLPLHFEAAAATNTFVAHGVGYGMSLSATGARIALLHGTHASVLGLTLLGSNPNAVGQASGLQHGRSAYFRGGDRSAWRTDVANYSRVRYRDVYPGVDQVYYGTNGALEYNFELAAGADPQQIRFAVGGGRLSLDSHGSLLVKTANGTLVQRAPVAYQAGPQGRVQVPVRYTLHGGTVGFALGAYDRGLPLTIDPVLTEGTTFGGTNDDAFFGIALDRSSVPGKVVIYEAGSTESPAASLPQPPAPTGLTVALGGAGDLGAISESLVVRFTYTPPAGAGTGTLTEDYAAYLGGGTAGSHGAAIGVAADTLGNAYVTGYTDELNTAFPAMLPLATAPTTPGSHAFVAKIGFGGVAPALVYSTLLGGTTGTVKDVGNGIALDNSNNVYVVGTTSSTDLVTHNSPTNTFQSAVSGSGDPEVFLAKLALPGATAATLPFLSYYGGDAAGADDGDSGQAVVVDRNGIAYIDGYTDSSNLAGMTNAFQPTNGELASDDWTAFVAKFNPAINGTGALLGATYLGGNATSPDNAADQATSIALDSLGNVYVGGGTSSSNFPTTPNAFQPKPVGIGIGTYGHGNGFVTELNNALSAEVYSTYLGGSMRDEVTGIAIDGTGAAYVQGVTDSPDFPSVNAPTFTNLASVAGTGYDAFVAKINPTGSTLNFSGRDGGAGDENRLSDLDGGITTGFQDITDYDFENGGGIAVDNNGAAYLAGWTTGAGFPVTGTIFPPGGGYNGTLQVFAPVFGVSTCIAAVSGTIASASPSARLTVFVPPVGSPLGATFQPFISLTLGTYVGFTARVLPPLGPPLSLRGSAPSLQSFATCTVGNPGINGAAPVPPMLTMLTISGTIYVVHNPRLAPFALGDNISVTFTPVPGGKATVVVTDTTNGKSWSFTGPGSASSLGFTFVTI